jgi:hypothetical protein
MSTGAHTALATAEARGPASVEGESDKADMSSFRLGRCRAYRENVFDSFNTTKMDS